MYVCYMFITVCIEATYVCVGGFIEITQCIVVNTNCFKKRTSRRLLTSFGIMVCKSNYWNWWEVNGIIKKYVFQKENI